MKRMSNEAQAMTIAARGRCGGKIMTKVVISACTLAGTLAGLFTGGIRGAIIEGIRAMQTCERFCGS